MQAAIKLSVNVGKDHTIHLPESIPEGPADVIVLLEPFDAAGRRRTEMAERRRRSLGAAAGQFTVPEDFDAPLPAEILRYFEGGEPEGQ